MYSEQTLTANLDAIERAQLRRPAFAPFPSDVRATPDRELGARVELRTAPDTWTPLDGADPAAQADAQLASAHEAVDILLIGPGLGYLLDAVERAGASTRVFVFEPDPSMTILFLSRRDWRQWINNGRLRVFTGPDYIGASACALMLDGTRTPAVVANPVLEAHRPRAVSAAREVALRMASESASNADARRRFAGRYLLQTLGNLPLIAREGDAAALDGAFTGRPAVLAAAGPALDTALPQLASLQDHAVLIAADTTLRPLLAAGVRPHVVVGVDPAPLNARHLAGIPDTKGIWLAAEGSLHPDAFGGFAGRTFVFKVSNHEPWRWLKTQGVERGTVRAWGSVTTSAFDLALRMGCDPIVFVGHDFAYTNNRPYCDNTIFHEEWRACLRTNPGTIEHYEDQMMNGRQTVDAIDVHGTPTRTAQHLLAFRNWLVEQTTVSSGRTFLNATGAGLLTGPNIQQVTLPEALDPARNVRLAVRSALSGLHARSAATPMSARELADGLVSHFDQPPVSDVVSRWVEFAANGIDRDAIRDALTRVACA